MSTRIIAIASHKGGVGKTTTAASLGSILAEKQYRVLLVDLDAQANLTASMMADYEGPTIYEALTDKTDTLPVLPINDWLSIVPASLTLAMADIELSSAIRREYILADILQREDIKDKYDFILLDCPPSLGLITLNAITAATDVIIPLVCEVLPFKGLTMMNNFITMVQRKLNPNVRIAGILVTRWERSNLSNGIETKLRETVNDLLFTTKIRKNIRLAEAPLESRNIMDYDSRCRGAKDYQAFAIEFLAAMRRTNLQTIKDN